MPAWYRFSISARCSSSTPFGVPGRAAGVHEDHRVGLIGLRRHDRLAARRAAPRSARRAERRPSPMSTTRSMPASWRTESTTSANSASTKTVSGSRVAQDERQLGGTEPQVQRVDDPGAEEAGVVQLEVLVPVSGHDRVPVASVDAELGPQGGAEAQDPLEVLTEGPVVRCRRGSRPDRRSGSRRRAATARTPTPSRHEPYASSERPCPRTSAPRFGTMDPGRGRVATRTVDQRGVP